MSGEYEVIWAATAVDDLIGIVDHIADDSPTDAASILERIRRSCSQLYHLPERGRIVPELQDQGIMQYHELIVTPWQIMFRITEKNVFVLSVIDSRRNVEDILLDRLTRPGVNE